MSDMREFCGRVEQAAANREDVTLWGVDYVALPVDADGVPIHVGDTVYDEDGREWHVCGVTIGESPTSWEDHDVHVTNDSNEFESFGSMQLTHTRPDSWERIADDIDSHYKNHTFISDDTIHDWAVRIRRLAER